MEIAIEDGTPYLILLRGFMKSRRRIQIKFSIAQGLNVPTNDYCLNTYALCFFGVYVISRTTLMSAAQE